MRIYSSSFLPLNSSVLYNVGAFVIIINVVLIMYYCIADISSIWHEVEGEACLVGGERNSE